jgi:lipid A 4'-phosphatase
MNPGLAEGLRFLMGIMTAAEPQAEFDTQKMSIAKWLLWGAVVVGLIAAVVFAVYPQLDIDASAFFYAGDAMFYGTKEPTVDALRSLLLGVNVLIFVTAAVGLMVSVILKRSWLSLPATQWLFLSICLVVGPGLVGNFALKNNWGRARPAQIVEFGGTKAYSPPLKPSDQCSRNCSFVAGEASTVFIAFFAAAFMFPGRARRLIAAGVVGGAIAGLIRMAQGAHFLSDVIFAGVTMALTAAAVHVIFAAIERTNQTKGDGKIKKAPGH